MTISRRLILTLSVALLALIFVGGLGLWRLNQAQQRFEYVQVNILPSIKELEGHQVRCWWLRPAELPIPR